MLPRPPALWSLRWAGAPLRSRSSHPLWVDWLAGDAVDRSGGDVRAHLHPVELDPPGGIVCAIAGVGRGRAERGDVEYASAGGDDLALALGGARVGDLGKLGGGVEAPDRVAL